MPVGSEGTESGIGLALSGGGFRAALFHCGAFCRLNELGYLQKLDRVSSVSGGSIPAGSSDSNGRSSAKRIGRSGSFSMYIDPQAATPLGWPYPTYALDKPLAQAVTVEPTRDLVEERGEQP